MMIPRPVVSARFSEGAELQAHDPFRKGEKDPEGQRPSPIRAVSNAPAPDS